MSKIKFDKEETKNLLNMLKSGDSENHTIAFQALQNAELKDYKGELLVLYKYAKLSASTWEKESPKAYKTLSKQLISFDGLTSGKCLSIMTSNNCSKDSIELFLENFVVDMVGFLEQLGYPADKFNINIELKE